MKTLLLIFAFLPTIVFSQIKKIDPAAKNDSLISKFYKKKDSSGVIPIPNKTIDRNQKFYGLISKSKGNTIPILNSVKPKDSLLATKIIVAEAIPSKK